MKHIQVIAEIGSNWNGSEKVAKKIIKAAKIAGVDYVKFQMWRANDLYDRSHPDWKEIKNSEFNPLMAKKLKKYSDGLRIGCFWSVFYPEAVDVLEDLNVKFYKVASLTAALKHKYALETLERISQTKKPVIISMGLGGNISQIKEIFKHNKKYFLYCISKYPTKIKEIDFQSLNKFDGFSDHTEGTLAPILFALKTKKSNKIKFLEKHVSIDESIGPDKPFSINMGDMQKMISDLREINNLRI